MIEYRGSLLVDKKFEGNFSLKRGTVIYARETEHGWLGMYYEDKGTGHGFALKDTDFSIWTHNGENEIVLMREEPEDEAALAKIREIEIEQARKRVDFRSRALGEATAELEALLYQR